MLSSGSALGSLSATMSTVIPGSGPAPATFVNCDMCVVSDTSSSMIGSRFESSMKGAKALYDSARPHDRIQFRAFNSNHHTLTGYMAKRTINWKRVEDGYRSKLGGCTRLYDAVNDAIDTWPRDAKFKNNIRVLIIFTDGEDVGSLITYQDFVHKIAHPKLGNVNIYLIFCEPDAASKRLMEQAMAPRHAHFLECNTTETDILRSFDDVRGQVQVAREQMILQMQFQLMAAANAGMTAAPVGGPIAHDPRQIAAAPEPPNPVAGKGKGKGKNKSQGNKPDATVAVNPSSHNAPGDNQGNGKGKGKGKNKGNKPDANDVVGSSSHDAPGDKGKVKGNKPDANDFIGSSSHDAPGDKGKVTGKGKVKGNKPDTNSKVNATSAPRGFGVFIGDLSSQATAEGRKNLIDYFTQWGSCRYITKGRRGADHFVILEYTDKMSAQRAIQFGNGQKRNDIFGLKPIVVKEGTQN